MKLPSSARVIAMLAQRDLQEALQARWLLGFALLFALLTVGISYFGLAAAREVGFQGFAQVSASLLNLALFTVPLVAMAPPLLGFTAEEGLAILLTQPVARHQVLLGKLLGMTLAVLLSLGGGLLLGGVIVLVQAGPAALGRYVLLSLLSGLLAAVFVAWGAVVALVASERARALGAALGLWFGLTVLYDLGVLGATIINPGLPLRGLLVTALLLNPVDAVRVTYLLASGHHSFVGVTGALLADTFGGGTGLGLLLAVLLAWIGLGTAIATWRFARRDL